MAIPHRESYERPESVVPRATQLAGGGRGSIYAGLTVVWAVMLWAAGMSLLDAIHHAMTTFGHRRLFYPHCIHRCL